jgi:hypothetical protein
LGVTEEEAEARQSDGPGVGVDVHATAGVVFGAHADTAQG